MYKSEALWYHEISRHVLRYQYTQDLRMYIKVSGNHNSSTWKYLPESAICSSSSPSSKRDRFRAGDEIGVACPSALEDLRSSQDLVGHTMPYIMLQRAVTSPGWEYLGMTLNFDGSVSLSYVICSIVFMCFQMFFNVFQWHWIKYNKININQQNIIKHRHIQLEHKSCQGLQFLTSAVSQKETQLSWSENHRKTMKNSLPQSSQPVFQSQHNNNI